MLDIAAPEQALVKVRVRIDQSSMSTISPSIVSAAPGG